MERPAFQPPAGARLARYVGDRLVFRLAHPRAGTPGWRAFLRTNLTRAVRARGEVVELAGTRPGGASTFAGASWRDIPLDPEPGAWSLDLPLTEVGYFRAKAYALDPEGRQHWPDGEDVGISVHPDHLRSGNTIYCAFPRLFGPTRSLRQTLAPTVEERLRALDARGYTVIPPSGTLRDLTACVPHIMERLGCRILHLLPVTPTPTVCAKMGRFGSPYAGQDLALVDPALVDFDRRSTGADQFRELAYAVHLRDGLLLLDIVVNHTGWCSRLQEEHPEWFKRDPDGAFHSPGAWGITWGDLVELDNRFPALWEATAEALLAWCRRGVDGFRCDAGYMVPLPTWQYLVARVRQEFPDTTFLLEDLGGPWEATEALLTEGGMQWAYSELFQNHDPRQVSGYLDHALRQGTRLGPLVHYSETHDNDRLAKRGRAWSLLRSRLCALASTSGAFGFTCGAEWLAEEKIDVHEARGLAWGAEPNLVAELSALNRLLAEHPCFFDGASVMRVSPDEAPALALVRRSAEGRDACLVLVNLDLERFREVALPAALWASLGKPACDLLGGSPPQGRAADTQHILVLEPGAAHCLAAAPQPVGLAGKAYRARRAQAAWAYRHLTQALPAEALGPAPWPELGALAGRDPAAFLAALRRLDPARAKTDLFAALSEALARDGYPAVLRWTPADLGRVVPVPPDHWLLVEDEAPFDLTLRREGRLDLHLRAIPGGRGHIAAVFPGHLAAAGRRSEDAELVLDRFQGAGVQARGALRLLSAAPSFEAKGREGLLLLTNGRGAMARLQADLGAIASKYDCLLAANLHPDCPSDRHVLAKRLRAWVNADGFLTALDGESLLDVEPGPPARWRFLAHAGDGRTVELRLEAAFAEGRNALRLRLSRPGGPPPKGAALPPDRAVGITLRLDLEDRSFHGETRACPEADAFFRQATVALDDAPGFRFRAAPDRALEARASSGRFHPEPEWSLGVPHPVEASRGQADRGDAWSPGWFELPLPEGGCVELLLEAEPAGAAPFEAPPLPNGGLDAEDRFGRRLQAAARDFLARRGEGLTVIAGYPWFLDWGRDTHIACRGLLAGGWHAEVRRILLTFARFERDGTLPNMLGPEDTANRESSDAPLWFGLACEEASAALGPELYEADAGGRPLREVLASIARHHLRGTGSSVRVDPASGLVWSPAHFTWMDTNHPAGSPREGYPVELQALWIRLLRQVEALGEACPREGWAAWAARAEASLDRFWNEAGGFFHDHLAAGPGQSAAQAQADGALRPNQLLLASLGLVGDARARRMVAAATTHLLIPGALRSLAPLPVALPLPIRAADGRPLNDPLHPYWGRYEGDEDTRRKPTYHNGTAWVWPLGVYAEALAAAWNFEPAAVAAARALLGSADRLLEEGCRGHLPEILDGDAPHAQRGCDAQAWSATELLRVWLRLRSCSPSGACYR